METADPGAFRTPTFSTIGSSPAIAASPALDRFAVRYLVVAARAGGLREVHEPGQQAGTTNVPAPGSLDVAVGGRRAARASTCCSRSRPVRDGNLMVDVLQGNSIRTGAGRRIFPTTGPGDLHVTLAGDDLTAAPVTLRIRNTMATPITLAASRSGTPLVGTVRPAADGLEVAQATPSGTVYERTRALPRLRWASTVDKAEPRGSRFRSPPSPGTCCSPATR